MISIQKEFLFIHVPKTGGNSIQNILRDYSEDKIITSDSHQDGKERFEVRNDKYCIVKHSTLFHYKKEIEANIYKKLFKFSTIRNPWDMMISFYFSPHRGDKKWNREGFINLVNQVRPLRDFIIIDSISKMINRKISMNIFPIQTIVLDSDIDFIMKFEHLNADFKKVCKKIDVPYKPLPHRNKSIRKHYSHYYDDELKKLVNDKFKEEIEWGEYVFKTV